MVQNLNITCIPTYLSHLLEIISKLFMIFIRKWEVYVNSCYNTFSGNNEKKITSKYPVFLKWFYNNFVSILVEHMDAAPWIQKANCLTGMPQEIIDTDFTQREGRQKFIKTALGILQTFILKIM